MNFSDQYYNYVCSNLEMTYTKNKEALLKGAQLLYENQINDHKIYTFGTGHSHMLGQDIYARAGGYAKVYPIVEIELTLATHPTKSTQIERSLEYASILEHLYDVKEGDVVIAASNSGRNSLVIEYLSRLKDKGVKIIAITSLEHSKTISSRHPSGKRLFELADIVLDNMAAYGDAGVPLNDTIKMGPTSTLTGCFLSQCLMGNLVELLLENKQEAPVFLSSNTDGADTYNQMLFDTYLGGKR